MQQVTERLFRAVGNLQGRGRLGSDGRLQMATPPRALVLGTGEQVPPGQSIRARLLIAEVGAGDVDLVALSQCQSSGQQGLLAGAMGAFVIWLAGHYQEVTERLGKRVLEIRSHSPGGAGHARTPSHAVREPCRPPTAPPSRGRGRRPEAGLLQCSGQRGGTPLPAYGPKGTDGRERARRRQTPQPRRR